MIFDTEFDIGDKVYCMFDNEIMLCVIAGIRFEPWVIGCDGKSKSALNEKFYKENIVRYFVVKMHNVRDDGSFDRYNVEDFAKRRSQIFRNVEEVVQYLKKNVRGVPSVPRSSSGDLVE